MLKRCFGLASLLIILAGCSQSTPTASLPATPSTTPSPSAVTTQPTTPPAVAAQPTTPPAVAAQSNPAPSTTPTPPPDSPPASAPAAAPAGVQDLIAQARQAVGPRPSQNSDFAGAVKLLEQAVAQDPKNGTALGLLAQYAQYGGMLLSQSGNNEAGYALFEKSGQYYRELRDSGQPLDEVLVQMGAQIFYNESCTFALQRKTEKAVASLNEALDAGWSDLAHIDQDTDFNSIRETPEFKALREAAPARLAAAAKEHAKKLMAANKPFDFSFSLPDLEGKTVSFADFKGKVLIVDVWGTWCPPCRMEIPHFVELYKKYREAGLEIVGLNYERVPQDKVLETIKDFVAQNGVTYKCVIGDQATQQMIPDFSGYPTTLFVDRTGKVRLKVVGYHPMESLEGIVSTLLSEGGSAPTAN